MHYEPKDRAMTVRVGETETTIIRALVERGFKSEGEVVRCAIRAYGRSFGMDVPREGVA